MHSNYTLNNRISHLFAKTVAASSLFAIALSGIPASASIVTFTGQDNVATPNSPHPFAFTAASNFDVAVAAAAQGTPTVITFESSPLGAFSNLTVSQGVTLNGTDTNGANQTIRNTSNFPVAPTLDGYNTTTGGSQFVEMQGGTLTFTFANGIDAFGAYFSGVQTNFFADTLTFSDGTSETILIPGVGTTSSVGALSWVGFTDFGKSITSITINAGSNNAGFDDIGVDDVQFHTVGAPEPTSFALLFAGLGLAGAFARRRSSRA